MCVFIKVLILIMPYTDEDTNMDMRIGGLAVCVWDWGYGCVYIYKATNSNYTEFGVWLSIFIKVLILMMPYTDEDTNMDMGIGGMVLH